MVIGADIPVIVNESEARRTAPVSLNSNWQTLIDAGGVDDPSAIANVDITTFAEADHHTFTGLKANATSMALMMAYDKACTSVTTQLIVTAVGMDTNSVPCKLVNSAATQVAAITLTADPANDPQDATHKYTVVKKDHIIDLLGHDRVLVTVQTAWNGANGNDALAFLLAKAI